MPEQKQKIQTAEEPEFSSRNVRSNIAPIFQILQSEQNILQRTDQKAFTLMSILGVFMVFFIVHFLAHLRTNKFLHILYIVVISGVILKRNY